MSPENNQPTMKDATNTASGLAKVSAGQVPTMSEVQSTAKVAGTGLKFQLGCCVGLFVLSVFVGLFVINLFTPASGSELSGDTGSGTPVVGDTEFWITTYDPAKGGINGRNCGGSMLKVCTDSGSPTGYVGKYGGNVVSKGVIAVPQDSKYHSGGHVDINEIPVPLLHSSKVMSQAKIIIPGYNNSEATPVGDHFASTVTKPNRLDLACRNYCPDMTAYWKKNKLKLDSGSGLNGGSKVMGKVVGSVMR